MLSLRLLCRPWPFEQQSPLRRTPHIRELPPKGHKWERVRVEREKQIAANMVKMPQLIADSKVWPRLLCKACAALLSRSRWNGFRK